MAPIVLYDACVLYPAPLRDLLMQLALSHLFQARWTEEIHDEWTRNVAANRPDLSPASLARCRKLMDAHVPDCLVTEYEDLIPTLTLPDPDDRHVLAFGPHPGASQPLDQLAERRLDPPPNRQQPLGSGSLPRFLNGASSGPTAWDRPGQGLQFVVDTVQNGTNSSSN